MLESNGIAGSPRHRPQPKTKHTPKVNSMTKTTQPWNGRDGQHPHVDTHDAPVSEAVPMVSVILPGGDRVDRLTVAEAITLLRGLA